MTPEEIVHAVFARVRAKDPSVAQLYAPDAVLDHGDGVFSGREAIDAFYRDVILNHRPQPHVQALFVNLPTVAALLRVETRDRGTVEVLDVFQVSDGFINEMRVCTLSQARSDARQTGEADLPPGPQLGGLAADASPR
jgi:predicted SnoaL-like aldol condensation-catalyzing enzyme